MDNFNRSINRMVIVLFIAAGGLGLIALAIIAMGMWQIMTGRTNSFSFLVLAMLPLIAALFFAGVAFWLPRLVSGSMKQMSSNGNPFLPPTQNVDSQTFDATSADLGNPASDLTTSWTESMPNTLAVNEWALKLARANHLDLGALTTNRAGRLSLKQIGTLIGSVAVELLFYAGLIGLLIAVGFGFSALNSQAWSQAVLPCGTAIGMLFVTGVIFNYSKRVGADRFAKTPWTIGLVILDVLLGRVNCVEGMTSRRVEEHESGSRYGGSDRSTDTRMTQYTYSYDINGQSINVSEDGYNAIPALGLCCRLYYLPRSQMLVNLEVTQ